MCDSGADSAADTEVYLSFAQSPRTGVIIFVRSTRDRGVARARVRRAIREIAPAFPVYDMQTMDERAAGATAQARFSAMLLGALRGLRRCRSPSIGIYGVMSLAVTARTREIGIRIALGADQRRVQRLGRRARARARWRRRRDRRGGRTRVHAPSPDACSSISSPIGSGHLRRNRGAARRGGGDGELDTSSPSVARRSCCGAASGLSKRSIRSQFSVYFSGVIARVGAGAAGAFFCTVIGSGARLSLSMYRSPLTIHFAAGAPLR